MKIADDFRLQDGPSGLVVSVVKGDKLDRLRVEVTAEPIVRVRDFFFTKDGVFDGTGCMIGEGAPPQFETPAPAPPEEVLEVDEATGAVTTGPPADEPESSEDEDEAEGDALREKAGHVEFEGDDDEPAPPTEREGA